MKNITCLAISVLIQMVFTLDALSQQSGPDFPESGSNLITKGNNVFFMDVDRNTIREGITIHVKSPEGNIVPVYGTPILDTLPTLVNGRKIYDKYNVEPPAIFNGRGKNMDRYIFDNLKDQIELLDDGPYWKLPINNIVIDEGGKIIYYEYHGLANYATDEKNKLTWKPNGDQQEILNNIAKKVDTLMQSCPPFQPALRHGRPVPSLIKALFLPNKMIKIKNHKATLQG